MSLARKRKNALFGKVLGFGSETTYRRSRSEPKGWKRHAGGARRLAASGESTRSKKRRKTVRYRGVSIIPVGDGEYTISIDRDSRFESVKDAKALIREFRKKNPSAFAECVREQSKRPGVYSPRGLCATMGRQKYGAAGMARKAAAGRRRARKGNPEEGAAAMYEKFHGRPSSKVEVFTDQVHEHSWLAQLGRLVYLIVKVGANKGKFLDFEGKGVRVACTENGGQLYFVGGNAEIALKDFGISSTLPKDHVELGPCVEICYHTQKGFHNFEPIDYNHKFSKKRLPVLDYDVMNKRPYLTGGSYQVKAEGIVQ